jgi:hypothetical protein
MTLILLLWHFGGGDLYVLVYDGDEEPTYKVPIMGYLADKHAPQDGRTYSFRFEIGDGFGEAVKKVEATQAYRTLATGVAC